MKQSRTTIDPGYQEQLEVQKYAEKRRQEIQRFIERNDPEYLTLQQAIELFKDPGKPRVFGIIEPQVVAALDYSPVRTVTRIREVTTERKQWLTEYWLNKYEIEIDDSGEAENFGEWNHEVGLQFHALRPWGSWPDERDYFPVTYDYPSCLISTFAVSRRAER